MRYAGALVFLLVLTSAAVADTIDEYLARIRAAKESLSAAAERPGRAAEAARLLSDMEEVRVITPDGDTIAVRNDWVREAVRELDADATGRQARAARRKLGAIEKQVEALRVSKAQPLDARLATGEEFMDGADKPTMRDSDLGIRKRLRRLSEWLRREPGEPERDEREPGPDYSGRPAMGVPAGLFWGIIIGLLGVLIAVIVYQVITSRSPKTLEAPKVLKLAAQPSIESALIHSPQEWKELARQYFENGDYTMALRALYLSLLVVLHRRRLISYETSKTNWEYVWELAGSRDELPPFESLTSAFDFKWYGRDECSSSDYLKLERLADRIVEREEKHV